jgi:hypothetical protein
MLDADARCWQVAVLRVSSNQHRIPKTCVHRVQNFERKDSNL